MLETTDFQQFLDPIVRTAIIPRRTIRSVMIDPGHGGTDQGATAAKGKVEEKALNLQIATRIGNLLRQRGYIVHYTRTKDTAVTLPARSAAAAKLKPDLFISVHCNSHADPKINGIELFIANPAGVPSYGTTTIGKDCPSVKFNTTNALWAFLMQSSLINATKATDRGVKRKQFAVVRETPTPAMLIEFGFLSNAAERKKLQDAKYQAKLAAAVADGVDSIAKLLQPPSKAPPARGTPAARAPARRPPGNIPLPPKPPASPASRKP
jgi:N-acetylmuramoyl-L-alanine amidase